MKRQYFRLKPEVTTNSEQFIKPKEQDRMKVGKPGDKYEVEADKAADAVVRRKESKNKDSQLSNNISKTVQLKEEDPIQSKEEEVQKVEEEVQAKEEEVQAKEEEVQKVEEEESVQAKEEELQAKSNKVKATNKPTVKSNDISKHKGKGSKMDSKTQKSMEKNFGVDFSNVKIHKGEYATDLNKKMHSKAFTTGNDIFFKSNNYNPDSTKGKHLLAHELSHTIQQKGKTKKK